MTNEDLVKLLDGKSDDWRKGFFAAVNLSADMKAAFLRMFIGQRVEVAELDPEIKQ